MSRRCSVRLSAFAHLWVCSFEELQTANNSAIQAFINNNNSSTEKSTNENSLIWTKLLNIIVSTSIVNRRSSTIHDLRYPLPKCQIVSEHRTAASQKTDLKRYLEHSESIYQVTSTPACHCKINLEGACTNLAFTIT